MKKLVTLAIAVLIGQMNVTAQTITVYNNLTSCDAKVFLFAEDGTYSCRNIESKPFNVPALGSVGYTSVADIEDATTCGSGSGRGWFIPSTTYCTSGTTYWDGAYILVYGGGSFVAYNVGESCTTWSTSVGGNDCTGTAITVDWDNTNWPNIIVDIHY